MVLYLNKDTCYTETIALLSNRTQPHGYNINQELYRIGWNSKMVTPHRLQEQKKGESVAHREYGGESC